MTDKTLHPSI